ncbi:MAG: UDP-N-acetylmuramoylalanine--D-glutamate ligase, partial [Frankiaceae bacterium]|nr:UDP-N-acetylmuramoylalanine--D-glutamate ligase [Frankiaceae bacterium]
MTEGTHPPVPSDTPSLAHPEWSGLPVVVLGVGLSGAAAAVTLAGLGARVLAFDDGDGERQQSAAAALRARGVDVVLGGLPADVPTAATALGAAVELIVTSPGLRPDTPIFLSAAAAGIPVWGEVELAYRLRPSGQAWLAVTGTNGKTTTTQMLGAILAAAGLRSTTAGNIGVPLLEAVTATEPAESAAGAAARSVEVARPASDVLAVELSSFQLHYTSTLTVAAGAVLNIADDHLDWHGSLEAYAGDKARVFTPGAVAVFNADDPRTVALAESSPARLRVGFRLGIPSDGELGVEDGSLVDRAFGGGTLLAVGELQVPGSHNLANALAAAALARSFDVPVDAVATALRNFHPGGHRNQVVATTGGITYVNDSKATNPHAA